MIHFICFLLGGKIHLRDLHNSLSVDNIVRIKILHCRLLQMIDRTVFDSEPMQIGPDLLYHGRPEPVTMLKELSKLPFPGTEIDRNLLFQGFLPGRRSCGV